jgi:putative ABC transport system ATP-binding protein
MELYRRRFGARLIADMTLRAINAANPDFADSQRISLFNRYFELVSVQKAIPTLLIGAFALILQALVGFVVTSFYHPVFLAFNVVVVLLVVVTFWIWSKGAMLSSMALSHEKYAASEWLESVGASDGFYKSADHRGYAIRRSEAMTARYVKAHARHYGYTLPQTVALYLIYAAASAGLLALGGWLVIQQQLSIGQLVAAELILSGVFLGISQLSTYLDDFYKLVASIEELALLYSIPQESRATGKLGREGASARKLLDDKARVLAKSGDLAFSRLTTTLPSGQCMLDFVVPSGSLLVAQGVPSMERQVSNLLKRQLKPQSGMVTLGDVNIASLDMMLLRSEVTVLDRTNIVETTIEEYLRLAADDAGSGELLAALRLVGLEDRVSMLSDGLQTRMSFTGYPLSVSKTMQVKLAAAVLAPPHVLVLSPLFDAVPVRWMRQVFAYFEGTDTTVIYFSNRPEDMDVSSYLWIGRDTQRIVSTWEDFDALRSGRGEV